MNGAPGTRRLSGHVCEDENLSEIVEFFDGESCSLDQFAKSPAGKLFVLRDGKVRACAIFGYHDMAPDLPANSLSDGFENLNCFFA